LKPRPFKTKSKFSALEAALFQNKIKTGVFQQTVKPAESSGPGGMRDLMPRYESRLKLHHYPTI
jgi:hypothetical protein